MAHVTNKTIELSHAGLRAMLLGGSLWVQLPKNLELKDGDTIGLSCGKPVGVAQVTDVVHYGPSATDGHTACHLHLKTPE